jgi:hypothetical protein
MLQVAKTRSVLRNLSMVRALILSSLKILKKILKTSWKNKVKLMAYVNGCH